LSSEDVPVVPVAGVSGASLEGCGVALDPIFGRCYDAVKDTSVAEAHRLEGSLARDREYRLTGRGWFSCGAFYVPGSGR
jgi:hypothetical protein